MNDAKGLSAETIGQISLMQSVVAQLPDKISILNFSCRGLTDVSGVERVEYCIPEDGKADNLITADNKSESPRLFHIIYKGDCHATLIVHLSEPALFSPYVPFIENFVQMIGVIFEEKRQRKLNLEIQAVLEKRVLERTRELETEIEAHRKAEADLKQSENKYRMLIENLPQRIFYKNITSEYITCNRNFADDLGISPDDIRGKTDFDLFPRDLAEKYRADDRRIIKSGKGEEIEENYVQAGEKSVVRTVKTPVTDDSGKAMGILGIFWDITKQLQIEEQLRQAQKMESIGTLAGGIAHDFNNILGIIVGNAEMAFDDIPEWSPAGGNLKEIKAACIRARDVVRQLLSFSRKTPQVRKPIKLEPIIKESLNFLRASIPTTIEIKQDVSDGCPAALADPTQIHQIIINLCSNAAHAMPDGGVLSVALSTHEQLENSIDFIDLPIGEYLQLIIQDTGEGIDPKIIDKIFDPYFSTKPVDKGTGMGLAVVHGIVSNHNGRIYASSEPGGGSRFTVFLPVTDSIAEETEAAEEKPIRGNASILIVDDEPSLAKVTRSMLIRLGYQVVATTDSGEALDLIKSAPARFDLIITDMTMPGMTGVELAEKVQNIRSDLPLILFTGYNERISKENARSFGFSEYIEKPLNKNKLAKAVRNALGQSNTK